MDFLGVSVEIFNLLVLGLLPAVSVILAVVFLVKCLNAMQRTVTGWFGRITKGRSP